MASVKEIREGLAGNLAAVGDYQISPYIISNPTPPTLYVYPGSPGGGEFADYHYSMVNRAKMTFTVRCIAGMVTDIGAQQKLDGFLDATGDSSVRQAIEADRTLGELVSDVVVVRSDSYSSFQGDKLAAEFQVEVIT